MSSDVPQTAPPRIREGRVHAFFAFDVSNAIELAQEAMHNALKHSRATRIDIELRRLPPGLELRVRDNGIGFPAQSASRGLGLRTMEQRARLISGQLKVQTHVDGGVEVLCTVPRAVVERVTAG